tara:strand:+ start:763 stop:876 length:114 start_codon:yes stop_codon:yes gene_type:complete
MSKSPFVEINKMVNQFLLVQKKNFFVNEKTSKDLSSL